MSTGLVWDQRFAWFDAGLGVSPGVFFRPFPATDAPESKERIRELVVSSGLLEHLIDLEPRPARDEDLRRYHTGEYLDLLRDLSDGSGGDAGDQGYVPPGGFDIARLAVGACIEAVDAVLRDRVDNAYALVRPCGHHVTRDYGRGFGVLANLALAVLYGREAFGIGRVAVVDWDAHHGNGTQDAFYEDPSVLTISIHQDGLYPPDSGGLEETGAGPGKGLNLNLPLPAGSGHGAYIEAFERVVLPSLSRFEPDLIVVASGLDASAFDPLARMMCHSDTFREMALMMKAAADEHCGGRLVVCHEGGYSSRYAPFCGLAILEAFSGITTDIKDPSMRWLSVLTGQRLQPHQDEAIRRVEELVAQIPSSR